MYPTDFLVGDNCGKDGESVGDTKKCEVAWSHKFPADVLHHLHTEQKVVGQTSPCETQRELLLGLQEEGLDPGVLDLHVPR